MTAAVPCTACRRPVRLHPVYDGGGDVFGESCARDRGLIGGRRPRPARPVRVDDPEQPSLLDQLETNNEGVMTMGTYRKKPVTVEAIQLTAESFREVLDFVPIDQFAAGGKDDEGRTYISIKTLEGTMRADIGDYVIRGVQGEFYPCKPDVFAATYEPVDGAR